MSNVNLNTDPRLMSSADRELENNIRPSVIAEFAGQEQIIENIKVFIRAAKMRERHWIMCCFTALPAWGKQRLAGSSPMSSAPK